MYDQREKALRDYEWAMSSAKEEGREEGLEEGREEGLEQGFVVGKLVGEIRILEELVGDPVSPDADLSHLSLNSLSEKRDKLQERLRTRRSS